MGYATSRQVYNILAQALTSATSKVVNGQPVPLVQFGKDSDGNTITDEIINQYISWAGDQIDAAISELYVTPLLEKTDLEMSLLQDIDPYNQDVLVSRASSLSPGDSLIFIDDTGEERHTVTEIINNQQIETQEHIVGTYFKETARVVRVKYPPTINLVCCRLAAANIYDKYFASQASPNVSDYGKTLRKLAISDLNSILNGIFILYGQKRIGHRFFNPNLRDRYGLPGIEGSDREIKGGEA